ncbi:unnamed protein product [Protopolystoma xenopodis]|uniref:Uncharacterized protein n=1 Tax=Protopolystoma xenopodis TaxID=117903 RepID=A0A3S5ABC1_9PLAT|nr:unnamed protein product [Protopolystoma xenopodis]
MSHAVDLNDPACSLLTGQVASAPHHSAAPAATVVVPGFTSSAAGVGPGFPALLSTSHHFRVPGSGQPLYYQHQFNQPPQQLLPQPCPPLPSSPLLSPNLPSHQHQHMIQHQHQQRSPVERSNRLGSFPPRPFSHPASLDPADEMESKEPDELGDKTPNGLQRRAFSTGSNQSSLLAYSKARSPSPTHLEPNPSILEPSIGRAGFPTASQKPACPRPSSTPLFSHSPVSSVDGQLSQVKGSQRHGNGTMLTSSPFRSDPSGANGTPVNLLGQLFPTSISPSSSSTSSTPTRASRGAGEDGGAPGCPGLSSSLEAMNATSGFELSSDASTLVMANTSMKENEFENEEESGKDGDTETLEMQRGLHDAIRITCKRRRKETMSLDTAISPVDRIGIGASPIGLPVEVTSSGLSKRPNTSLISSSSSGIGVSPGILPSVQALSTGPTEGVMRPGSVPVFASPDSPALG